MEKKDTKEIKVTIADPSALGLFGLAMVTLVASSQKLGLTSGLSLVIPWAVFLGALAQLVAGIIDFKRNNVFGGTAFCLYGFFWLGMALSWMINMGALGSTLQSEADTSEMGFAFIGYLVITIFLTIGALETHKVLLTIFILIDVLFLGLAVSTLTTSHGIEQVFHNIAAFAEMGIAICSFYGGGAAVVNAHVGRVVLPVGRPCGILTPKNKKEI